MKYPGIITALLLPLAVHAAPRETASVAQSASIEAQAKLDPAIDETLPAADQRVRVEAQAVTAVATWTAAQAADSRALQQLLAGAAAKREPWFKESYSVVMKAAALLATGKPGGPAPGRQQLLDLTVTGGNHGQPESISATVTLIGGDDEKLPGERFEFDLRAKADGTWSITKATRATLALAPAGSEE